MIPDEESPALKTQTLHSHHKNISYFEFWDFFKFLFNTFLDWTILFLERHCPGAPPPQRKNQKIGKAIFYQRSKSVIKWSKKTPNLRAFHYCVIIWKVDSLMW